MGPHSSNKLNFIAHYYGEKIIFSCDPHEIVEDIEARLKINMQDVDLYAVHNTERMRIFPNDIIDLMKIEIVPKYEQNNMPACVEEASNKKMIESMISKLRQNTTLTGEERKMLIKALETHSTGIFLKRKLDQTDVCQQTEAKSHKKIQVNFKNSKDSFTQTDAVVENNVHLNKEDDAKITLKRIWNSEPNSEEIEILMTDTFAERRNFIYLKSPPVSAIKEQYPALFCVEQVKNELDRIFYPGKCLDFLSNMQKYSKVILHYKDAYSTDILERTKRALNHARTPVQQSYAEVVGSVFVLAESLEENFGFIHLSDYPHSSKDIYPHIDASCHSLKKIFYDQVLFHIMVEGQHLCEASNFPEALLCLMASFFIFNIDYPDSCRCTLTVIEKVFLEANDTADMDEKTEQMIKLLKCRRALLKP